MAEANSINAATTGIVGNTGTGFTGTAVTQYNLLSGGATSSTLNNIAPSSTSGYVLKSNGSSAHPSFQNPTSGLTSWTPQIAFGGTPAAGWTYTVNQGYYCTIGNMVYVTIYIVVAGTSGTPAGTLGIVTLPVTPNSSTNYASSLTGTFYDFTSVGSNTYVSGIVNAGSTTLQVSFTYLTSASLNNPVYANLQAGTALQLSGWYSS